MNIKVLANIVINYLAKKGLMADLLTCTGIVVSQIPVTTISTYLSYSFQQNLPHLEKNKFIVVSAEKIYLDQCD
jgi:hypothetical protein